MLFSKRAAEGYLMVDHRASPGLTEEEARLMGYDPLQCREGKVLEQATLWCIHCGGHWLKKLDRTRDRPHCYKCNFYICDGCEWESRQPDYIHRNIYEKSDLPDVRGASGITNIGNPRILT